MSLESTLQVGIQAYLLWEKAGQPDGADFSNDARKALEKQLERGATIEHLQKSLNAPAAKEPEPKKEQPQTVAPPREPEVHNCRQDQFVDKDKSKTKIVLGLQILLHTSCMTKDILIEVYHFLQ